ncbi:MAG TPA: VOC family protein [Bryobacteraceae bacterium]|nr:VOC family protein [Bryobacteraceae bacterium]
MPVIDTHRNGAPCWFELATSDHDAADAYYRQVFGWEVRSSPLPFGGRYTIFQEQGRDVGSAYKLMPDMVAQGIPPHWMVYFSADDVDASAKRVAELGGRILHEPFDVMTHGRMATCADPEGTAFSLWEARSHIGAGIFGEVNTVCRVELATRDLDRAEQFYPQLLGWEIRRIPHAVTAYTEISVPGEKSAGGMILMNGAWQGIPAHWGVYFRVADVSATAERIRQAGGSVEHGPFEVPNLGVIAVAADPQGAISQVIQLTALA